MKQNEAGTGPVAPGLVQLDDKTLVRVRLARSGASRDQFRAVALAALRSRRKVVLVSSQTVGFGPDPQSALEACLSRVRATLAEKKRRSQRLERRPEASL